MPKNPIRIARDAVQNIKGNARTLIITEPLFSIPYMMFSGYMTLYMLALGVTKSQVGLITSLSLAVQIVFSLLSAYVTDKFGRKRTTLIFDSICWVGAILIWAIAQNIYYFIAAAIVNSVIRITLNSYHCLMLEDAPNDSRVYIFNFLMAASIMAGFFSPLGALLINKMTLVPAMRAMLFSGAGIFMALFIIRNHFVTETEVGRQKIQEMKNAPFWGVFKSYLPTLMRIIKNKMLMIALLMKSLYFIEYTIRSAFLAVLVTERLGFPAEAMAVFFTFNSVIMLIALLFITPALTRFTRRWPISLGFWFHILGTLALLLSPPARSNLLLIAAAILIALGTSISAPRIDTLFANAMENEDRSVANAVVNVILLLLSTPFGFIGGVLADIDPRLPFLLTLIIFLICQAVLRIATLIDRKDLNSGIKI